MGQLMCVVCSTPAKPRRATPGYRTCSPCSDRIAEALTEIPDQYGRLASVAAMLPGSVDTGRRSPGFASTSPARDIVLSLTDWRTVWTTDDRLHNPAAVLHEWATQVREECNEAAPVGPVDIRADAALLARRLDHITRQHWVVDLAGELAEIRDQLRTIAGQPAPVPVGRCPVIPEGRTEACGTPLFVRQGTDVIRCRGCGEEWPRPRWQLLGRTIGVVA